MRSETNSLVVLISFFSLFRCGWQSGGREVERLAVPHSSEPPYHNVCRRKAGGGSASRQAAAPCPATCNSRTIPYAQNTYNHRMIVLVTEP